MCEHFIHIDCAECTFDEQQQQLYEMYLEEDSDVSLYTDDEIVMDVPACSDDWVHLDGIDLVGYEESELLNVPPDYNELFLPTYNREMLDDYIEYLTTIFDCSDESDDYTDFKCKRRLMFDDE